MKQRDIYYLQKIANDVRKTNEALNYVNFKTKDDRLYCEASDGFCYAYIWEDVAPNTSLDGLYSFEAGASNIDIIIEQALILHNSLGERVALQNCDLSYPRLRIGKQGLYKATFDIKELFNLLKFTLTGFKSSEKLFYRATFIRKKYTWLFIGTKKDEIVYQKEIACNIADTIVDDNFRFTVNAHSLRTIMKWQEEGDIDFYFHNISGQVRENIVIINPSQLNKICVIKPIYARAK